MLIEKLSIRNFRAFGPRGIELETEPLNILVGANGSGKSSLLCALDQLRFHALAAIAERQSDQEAAEMAHEAIDNHRKAPAAQITATTRLAQFHTVATIDIANGSRQVYLPPEVPAPDQAATICRLDNQYAAIRRFPCYPGYASLIENVAALSPGRVERLSKRMSAILPQWADINVDPPGMYTHQGTFHPVDTFSVGIRRHLAMQAELLQPEPPPLMLIEHPETGLHPDTAPSLAETLIAASRNTQLFVTTHSAELVDQMIGHPSSVVTFAHRDGEARCRRTDPGALTLRGLMRAV